MTMPAVATQKEANNANSNQFPGLFGNGKQG
jgi:hypothetical protein